MRGVSARSLNEVLDTTENLNQDGLGDELFAIVSLLDSAPALRRAITDPATDSQTKSQLAETLIGDRVSPAAARVLDSAVRLRWGTPREFTDAVELAGVCAYAGVDGDIDRIEDELFELGRLIQSDAGLRAALSDRTVDREPKMTLLERIAATRVSATVLALANQALRSRTGSFEKVLDTFANTAAERYGIRLAEVRVAHALAGSERDRLATALSQRFGSRIHVNIIVDPAVIGGMSVSVGSQVLDGTMSSRLETARRRLAG